MCYGRNGHHKILPLTANIQLWSSALKIQPTLFSVVVAPTIAHLFTAEIPNITHNHKHFNVFGPKQSNAQEINTHHSIIHLFNQQMHTVILYYTIKFTIKLVQHVSNPYFGIIIRDLDCELHKLQINNYGTF
jgi:hypothetical protein